MTAPGRPGSFTLAAVGQSLIIEDVRVAPPPGFPALVDRIRRADLAFTNFEASLAGDGADGLADPHPSDPVTLEALRWMGFDVLSLANNHAFEGGSSGVVRTRQVAEGLGFAVAGTGADLAEAAAPAFVEVAGRTVAFLAFDTANLQTARAVAGEGGPAGVNPLRGTRDDGGVVLDHDDVGRALAAIAGAASQADHVLVSLHEHLWPGAWKDVAFQDAWPEAWCLPMEWKRAFAREAIDAGAAAFLGHGFPRASPVEVYRGRPIFHSLGNFIFQTDPRIEAAHPGMWHMPDVWHAYVAEVDFVDGGVGAIRLHPVVLADRHGQEGGPITTRTHPIPAPPGRAAHVLAGVVRDSAVLGLAWRERDGWLEVELD